MGSGKVVLDFMDDVLNRHNGDRAGEYFTEDMAWHGGTVGTVAGRDAVAGLMTTVVTARGDVGPRLLIADIACTSKIYCGMCAIST